MDPTGPGVSVELCYPVLPANERQLVVKDSIESLGLGVAIAAFGSARR